MSLGMRGKCQMGLVPHTPKTRESGEAMTTCLYRLAFFSAILVNNHTFPVYISNRPHAHISIMAEAHLEDFPSLFTLKGKVVVVTGGSRGLGLHAASA